MKKLLLSIFLLHSCCIFGMVSEENKENLLLSLKKDSSRPLTLEGVAKKIKNEIGKKESTWLLWGFSENYGDYFSDDLKLTLRWYTARNKKKDTTINAIECCLDSESPDKFLLQLGSFLSEELFQKVTVIFPKKEKSRIFNNNGTLLHTPYPGFLKNTCKCMVYMDKEDPEKVNIVKHY